MKGKLLRILPFGIALICLGSAFLTVGCGSSSARYRFMQAATAIPTNVDLQVDGKTVQSSLGFGQPATYHSTKSGSRHFVVFPAGSTTTPYADSSFSLASGDTTVIMEGPASAVTLAPYTDDNTAPTTGNAKLRIIHASPLAGNLDVYVVPANGGIAGFNPQLSNIKYPDAQNYLSLAASDYDVIMTQPGTQNIVLSLDLHLPLTAGQIRTVVVLDAPNGGGPFSLAQLNDLN